MSLGSYKNRAKKFECKTYCLKHGLPVSITQSTLSGSQAEAGTSLFAQPHDNPVVVNPKGWPSVKDLGVLIAGPKFESRKLYE